MPEPITLDAVAGMIDHSLLHPTLTDEDIAVGCLLARDRGVAAACVKPYSVAQARDLLLDSAVSVCAVVAFPHGNSATSLKVLEAEQAIADGAVEIDVPVNAGKVLGGDWAYVFEEIRTVNAAVTARGAIVKVIFETDFLHDAAIVRLCEICSEVGVAFVKTSTGYGFVRQENGFYTYRGATDHHLRLMRQHCPPSVQVKAAGGIRTLDDVLRVRAIGVARIGATATETILSDARKRGFPAASELPSSDRDAAVAQNR